MLIVVEGLDRTGKSSLCERLAEEHGGRVAHFSRPERDAVAEYLEPLETYIPGGGENVYLDRHYLGELVWPVVFGRESRMTQLERHCVELFLLSRGAVCVLTRREPRALAKACVGEPVEGRTGEAVRLFKRAARSSALPWWTYKHGDDPEPIVLKAAGCEQRSVDEWDRVWTYKDMAVDTLRAR